MALQEPITFAVMPNLPHSKEESQKAHAKGFEIIWHQPMEQLMQKKD